MIDVVRGEGVAAEKTFPEVRNADGVHSFRFFVFYLPAEDIERDLIFFSPAVFQVLALGADCYTYVKNENEWTLRALEEWADVSKSTDF